MCVTVSTGAAECGRNGAEMEKNAKDPCHDRGRRTAARCRGDHGRQRSGVGGGERSDAGRHGDDHPGRHPVRRPGRRPAVRHHVGPRQLPRRLQRHHRQPERAGRHQRPPAGAVPGGGEPGGNGTRHHRLHRSWPRTTASSSPSAPQQSDCFLQQHHVPTISGTFQDAGPSKSVTPNFTLVPPPAAYDPVQLAVLDAPGRLQGQEGGALRRRRRPTAPS